MKRRIATALIALVLVLGTVIAWLPPLHQLQANPAEPVYVTTANLNLRLSPSTAADSHGVVERGTRVYILAVVNDEWHRVRTSSIARTVEDEPIGNMVGYMASEFLMPAPVGGELRIGVTAANHDDVGGILRNIRGGIDFDVITSAIFNDFSRLSEYNAIFINCGSQGVVNRDNLRRFVREGGVVYASDLAAHTIQPAFPDIFTYSTSTSAQTVNNASIVHTSLATHMGRNSMNIVFNMGQWAAITSLDPNATVYISGNVPGRGEIPLAFSFDYGRGRVFFTSFHNNAQANADMVNFIEYLVFRIQHFEAERVLVNMADEAGYDFDGAVFGVLDANEESDPFFYTPAANDFMLLFDPDMGDFTIILSDPDGALFSTEDTGILTDLDIDPADLHLAFGGFPIALITDEMVVESLGNEGFRVLNPTDGEWSFWVRSNNEESDMFFAVGLAERPTAALTRAMFTQVLANLDEADLTPFAQMPASFDDVHSHDWFFAPVEWAYRNGIVDGVGRNRFSPNGPLTREQMVTMLYNYTNVRDADLPYLRTGEFPDLASVSSWARGAVSRMYIAGVISRQPDGNFGPREVATTTEIAEVFENLLPFLDHVHYIHDSVLDIERFMAPPSEGLTQVSSMAGAQTSMQGAVTGLTPYQRQSGEALNVVALYMENVMRRGTTQRVFEDGYISASMLRSGANIANNIRSDAADILVNEDVHLMRDLRTNVNFETIVAYEIDINFPDDVTGIDFDNLTIESQFAAITIDHEHVARGNTVSVRPTDAVHVGGVVDGHGEGEGIGARIRGVFNYMLDFSTPMTILANFWFVIVLVVMLIIWLVVAGLGERLKLWVVPAIVLVAVVVNIGLVTHRYNNREIQAVGGDFATGQNIPQYVDAVEVAMTDGMRATLSLPVNGSDPEFMVLVNENGEIQHSRHNPVTDTIDARIRTGGIYTLVINEVSFADIADQTQQMQDAIRQLTSRGIMRGATENYFHPEDPISRTEMVATIVMAFDMLDFDAQVPFTDIDPTAWYYLAVATAYQERIIEGFDDNTFRGDMYIPKDQLVVMTANTMVERMGYHVPSDIEYFLARFLDRQLLARWSEDGIALATASNVLIHRTDSLFAPHSSMTRGDAAIVLYRVFNRVW